MFGFGKFKNILKALFSPRHRGPTKKQVEYLNKLVAFNNGYRSQPWTIADWTSTYLMGQWNRGSARILIKKLRSENERMRNEFAGKLKERSDRKENGVIFASDFSSFSYCPNSFYLTFRGYASRNLYELDQGRLYHGDFGNGKDRANQNSLHLRNAVDGIESIRWSKPNDKNVRYSKELNLAGVPDGTIKFKNGKLAVVELKTRTSIHQPRPYWGDIMQACAYVHLLRNDDRFEKLEIDSRMFVLYIKKGHSERQLYAIDFDEHKDDFLRAYHEMKQVQFDKTLHGSNEYRNKCGPCGHRVLCKKIASG